MFKLIRLQLVLLPILATLACQPLNNRDVDPIQSAPILPSMLYSQLGKDVAFTEVLQSDALKPVGTFTRAGVEGAKVDINNALIETGPYGSREIQFDLSEVAIHTLAHPLIKADEVARWSRWYQVDGNTQVFRLFKDEVNVSNKRENAARIEAFVPTAKWLPEPGVWREFTARFTIIKSAGCVGFHHCSIFQAKGNNVDHWSVMLRVDDQGALWYHPRRGFAEENSRDRQLISRNVIGRPFDLKVRDNGLDYEMYIDGQIVGKDQWHRTKEIGFRWGIYVGESEVADDIIVTVSGVGFDSN